MSDNRLDQDFRIPALLKFTAPTAVMMVFMALYQMVDGAFVAQFVGENALSALNIVYPVPSIMFAFSIMLSTGSSAIIARNMNMQMRLLVQKIYKIENQKTKEK